MQCLLSISIQALSVLDLRVSRLRCLLFHRRWILFFKNWKRCWENSRLQNLLTIFINALFRKREIRRKKRIEKVITNFYVHCFSSRTISSKVVRLRPNFKAFCRFISYSLIIINHFSDFFFHQRNLNDYDRNKTKKGREVKSF